MLTLLLACAGEPPPPPTLSTVRIDGPFRVESNAMGVDGIRSQRDAISKAQSDWAAQHPDVTVVQRFATMPFLTIRTPMNGGQALPFPGMPLRALSGPWSTVVIDQGFKGVDLLDGACFTDGDCPGDIGLTTAAAGCVDCMHGAHVASVVHSAAPGLGVLGLRIFDNRSSMRQMDLLRALEFVHTRWAAEYHVAVVNLSLGLVDASGAPITYDSARTCAEENPALAWMVATLRNDGIAVVAAAGDGRLDDRIALPACLPGVIAVGAATHDGKALAEASNIAPFLSVIAPGVDIDVPGGPANGSSLAAPAVSARIATLRAADPEASLSTIELAFFGTTEMVPARGGKSVRALRAAEPAPSAPATLPPGPTTLPPGPTTPPPGPTTP